MQTIVLILLTNDMKSKTINYLCSALTLLCFMMINTATSCYAGYGKVQQEDVDPNYFLLVSRKQFVFDAMGGTKYVYITSNYKKIEKEWYNRDIDVEVSLEKVSKTGDHPAPPNNKYKVYYYRMSFTGMMNKDEKRKNATVKIRGERDLTEKEEKEHYARGFYRDEIIEMAWKPNFNPDNVPTQGSEQTQDYKRQLTNQ